MGIGQNTSLSLERQLSVVQGLFCVRNSDIPFQVSTLKNKTIPYLIC